MYEERRIYFNETSTATELQHHLAVFADRDRNGTDYVASCLTFVSPTQVPPGNKYNVIRIGHLILFW